MGNQYSLNCGTALKQKQHQIQTTQNNAINLIKNHKEQSALLEQSQPSKFKQSTVKTQSQAKTTVISRMNNPYPILPQHQNIIKVAHHPFFNSQQSSINSNYQSEKKGKSLAEIISSRYNTNMYFPHRQIISLLQSLIYSLAYLAKHEYKHHDFYPTNIYYSAPIFKIDNPLLIHSTAYALTHERKRFSFLSPQLISALLEDTSEGDISISTMIKSDIFAIGMILLEFCTLQPSSECYDEQNYTVINTIVHERLNKIKKIYSNNIAYAVGQMLSYHEDDRINIEQLSLLILINSAKQKKLALEAQAQQQQGDRMSMSQPQIRQQRPLMQNPMHLQPNYLILPQGQVPPGQMPVLGPNNVAVPTPNYLYSHIGPNNQGLLSPSTLHNKLRVIQKIHQKPHEEEDSQGQGSNTPSSLLPTISNEPQIIERNNVSYPREPVYPRQQDFYQRDGMIYKGQPIKQQNMQMHYEQPYFSKKVQEANRPNPQVQNLQYNNQQKMQQIYRPTNFITSSPIIPVNPLENERQTLEQKVERVLQMSRSLK